MQRHARWTRRWIATALAALVTSGCATATREATFGPLPDGHPLLRLVVSEDLKVIRRECLVAHPNALGCQISVPTVVNGLPVRRVTVVRYTDAIPSPLAFEIDAHELCHTVASLQLIVDPCHIGNGGMARTR
jgi:hypothetical protein